MKRHLLLDKTVVTVSTSNSTSFTETCPTTKWMSYHRITRISRRSIFTGTSSDETRLRGHLFGPITLNLQKIQVIVVGTPLLPHPSEVSRVCHELLLLSLLVMVSDS